jgi:hypothetical protein
VILKILKKTKTGDSWILKFWKKNRTLEWSPLWVTLVQYWMLHTTSSYPIVFKMFGKHGACHTEALQFYIKKYLKAKEELWKLKYFTMQKCNLQKIL